MFVGISDAGIHAGDEFRQLGQVFQQGPAAGEYDAGNQFLFVARILDLVIHMFNDLLHSCLYDAGQVLQADLFGRPAAQPRNGNNFIVPVLAGQGGAEFHFQLFGMFPDDGAALFHVFGDHITPKGDHSRMPDDAILEDGQVSGSTPDVDQHHTRLFFFFAQHRFSRCNGLQDQVDHFKA